MRKIMGMLVVLGLLVGGVAPSYAVDQLPVGTGVDYQLGGNRSVPDDVGIVVRERTARPAGRYDVCYVNGFQTQPNEKRFWKKRRHLLLRDGAGKVVVDEAWGEWLLDIRTPQKRRALARVVGRWTAGCARAGYEAVEYDNLDSFTRSHGLVRKRHAVAFSRLLTRRAHRVGLAVGQKNLAGFHGRRVGFDFAVAEECGRYDECGQYAAEYGRRVLVIEYRRQDLVKTCREYGDRLAVVYRDRDLSPDGVREYCRK
ncbi:endo alpha-1,4 polygalactosaminidase [Nocardioides lianchengensis]|uniref:Glycoside-hydrolase family GH114 n=1 Tax=Nocardioides lianchengensis TaxID=1045774 RepID=A0A1G6X4K7_9ACTN|nr:endo alpha-1,4 polygalactosaminidase [Nocardioides lianchengensis]NYG09097.1 hypothetical protein [Nocardioides lianchengensis]SDD73048.1 Glycoside-hydrolase family GH114 [Nocardioides lianchengensis]